MTGLEVTPGLYVSKKDVRMYVWFGDNPEHETSWDWESRASASLYVLGSMPETRFYYVLFPDGRVGRVVFEAMHPALWDKVE